MEVQFIDKSVNVSAVNRFFDRMTGDRCEVHTLQIYIGGKKLLRIAKHPYSCSDVRELCSLGKTFTASVVGCAVDRGYLTVEDKVLDFFPEIETDNENFKNLRVRHVLSMNTGQKHGVMRLMKDAKCAAHGFFSLVPEYEPGTHFTYNTGASCLLGCIVERATKERFFDFACRTLLWPLDITEAYWTSCKDGSCIAGGGFHASNDDIIKLFLTYASGGVYEGKRILSEEWVKAATAVISDTSALKSQSPNSGNGYGYQIWHNEHDGYRGDGALGQLGIVFPKYDAVVAVQGISSSDAEINAIIELLEDITTPDPDGAEPNFYHFEPYEKVENVPQIDRTYKIDADEKYGLKLLRIRIREDKTDLSFSDGETIQTVSSGNGYWQSYEFTARNLFPTIFGMETTEYGRKIAGESCFTIDGNKIVMDMRYHVSPIRERYEISFSDDSVEVVISNRFDEEDNKYIRGKLI